MKEKDCSHDTKPAQQDVDDLIFTGQTGPYISQR